MATHHMEGTPTGHEGHEHHVLPFKVYVGVYLALLVLTYITVQVSFLGLGALSLPVAMIVAFVKAGFVVGFFMHLRYDDRFLSLVFFTSLFFIAVFFSFTMFDLMTRGKLSTEHHNFSPLLEEMSFEQKGLGVHTSPLTAQEAIKVRFEKQKKEKKAKPTPKPAPAPSTPPEVAYQEPPKDMLELGKAKFQQLCALCHGPKGLGDGPGAKGLAVKPSAYGKGEFRLTGGKFDKIMEILKKGSIQNGMASYAWMPLKERKALSYYILHLAHKGTGGKKKTQKTGQQDQKTKAQPAPARRAEKPKARKAAYQPPPKKVLELGQTKFQQLCALCHGPKGLGDGPGAKGLAVKPSAYGKGEFRLTGGKFDKIMEILKKGSIKNGMASYAWMPKNEREALAHYVLHLAHTGSK